MAVQSYPQEIWDRLKEVYESSPKITWQKLVDQVREELGCDVPHFTNVRRRAIAEKWKKKVKETAKLDANKLNKKIKELAQNDNAKNNRQDTDGKKKSNAKSGAKNDENIIVYDAKNSPDNSCQDNVRLNQLTAALTIKKMRDDLAKLSELTGDTIDSVIHIRDEVLRFDISNMNAEEAEKAISELKFKVNLVNQIVELNVKQSITLANVGKMQATFWGLEVEDLKDQSEQQAKRTAAIDGAEERMRIAKENMARDKKAAFARKLAMIEAGDPDDVEIDNVCN